MKFSPFLILSIAGAFIAPPAHADTPKQEKAPPEIYARLAACRAITDAPQRLACFDAASSALDAAIAARDVVVVDKAQMKETRKSLFGFSLPSLNIFGGKDEESEDMSTLETTIKSVFRASTGGIGIVLEDGARWVQIDDKDLTRPQPGQPIKLRKASMGSFFANINGGRAVRMKREN